MIIERLTLRQRLTWLAHTWKAVAYQHHGAMRQLFQRYVTPTSTILDVGAHAGQYAKLFSRMVPGGRVVAVEPGSYARSILALVIRLHRLRNVDVMPVAAGRRKGSYVLNIPIKESGSLGFGLGFIGDPPSDDRAVVSETVTVTTIDDLLAGYHGQIPNVDLIKADIEGYEHEMLHGAVKTLGQSKPALYIEVVDTALERAGTSKGSLFSFLQANGYLIADLETGRKKAWSDGSVWTSQGDLFFLPA